MKTSEQVQAEKLEILRYNRARIAARPDPETWEQELVTYDSRIARVEAGDFFNPYGPKGRSYDRSAHEHALRLARRAA